MKPIGIFVLKTCTHQLLGSYYFLGWEEGVGGAGDSVLLAKDNVWCIKRLLI